MYQERALCETTNVTWRFLQPFLQPFLEVSDLWVKFLFLSLVHVYWMHTGMQAIPACCLVGYDKLCRNCSTSVTLQLDATDPLRVIYGDGRHHGKLAGLFKPGNSKLSILGQKLRC